MAGLAPAQGWDRFGHWSQGLARAALALLAVLLVLAALAPGYAPPPPAPPKIAVADPSGHTTIRQEDDNDLHLYRLIIARVRAGDDYYRAAVEEQRRNHYPVAPGFTVRLPTLAITAALVGDKGVIGLGIALFTAMMLAANRRVLDEPGGGDRRPMALALLMAGIASGLNYKYNVLHEIWAAQLMALSLLLHRPGAAGEDRPRWGWAVAIGALALAVRELVLPYILLMAAYALWRRQWREAAAWGLVVALFGLAMAVHLHLAEAQVRPGDPLSPSWMALRGLAGLLYKVNNSTFLSLLPVWLSGPLVVLALLGWAGWRSPLGSCGFLLTFGYAVLFMVAGRDNNFYWGVLITPLLFMGGAFVPIALPSLWRRAMLAPAQVPAHG